MKFYKPFFSLVIILIQLVLSIISYFNHIDLMSKMKDSTPELYMN